jgi:hypothetical protein
MPGSKSRTHFHRKPQRWDGQSEQQPGFPKFTQPKFIPQVKNCTKRGYLRVYAIYQNTLSIRSRAFVPILVDDTECCLLWAAIRPGRRSRIGRCGRALPTGAGDRRCAPNPTPSSVPLFRVTQWARPRGVRRSYHARPERRFWLSVRCCTFARARPHSAPHALPFARCRNHC